METHKAETMAINHVVCISNPTIILCKRVVTNDQDAYTVVVHGVIAGAYERRSCEGACNYRVCPSAVQIQIIS